jgi:dipeptidyl aminopeptidase/acylaminoacyl peptidase
MNAEFGVPQWSLAAATYAWAGPDRIVASYVADGLGRLAVLDLGRKSLTPIELPFTEFGSVRALGERVLLRAAAPNHPLSIVVLDLASGNHRVLQKATRILDQPDLRIGDYLTTVRPVEFPTTDGKTAFGLLYPPHNPDYAGPADEKPPLLVKCHGGPTGLFEQSESLDAVLDQPRHRGGDVNYGGSTGFGRGIVTPL